MSNLPDNLNSKDLEALLTKLVAIVEMKLELIEPNEDYYSWEMGSDAPILGFAKYMDCNLMLWDEKIQFKFDHSKRVATIGARKMDAIEMAGVFGTHKTEAVVCMQVKLTFKKNDAD